MKRVILSALAAGIFATAAAQEELTLRKCLEIGLENNYDIRIVRNGERISDNNATAANAGMVPTIDFEAGYSGALDNERTTPREGDAWSDNGIYDQTFNAGINLNWTIFDGFRIRTNYKKLKEMQEMGTVRTRITIEDFVASLTAEYYNYVQQTLRLQNFRYAVALSRERLRITEARVSVGNFSRLDLLQARVDFNADSSKYMSQQELVSASRIRINELLANKDVNEMLCIRDSVIEVNGELKWEELLAQTLDTNASLLLAGHDNVLAELDLKTVQARNYPYLNLTTGYGYTYNRFGNGTTRSRGTLGLNAGVKLGITIFDGNRRREQRNARIDVENAQLTRERLEQSLRANLSNFWQAYRNNLEVIQLEKENLIAAKENYEIAMERYLLGDLPGIEMREAQKSLLDAEERIRVIDGRDRAKVYVEGTCVATQYQEHIGEDIKCVLPAEQNRLDILMENMGRVGYGHKLLADTQHKGIRTGVCVDLHFITGWEQRCLPLTDISGIDYSAGFEEGQPAFHRFEFNLDEPADTFIDTTGFGKGCAFVNGVNVGRFWEVGPIMTLYVPHGFTRAGVNELVLFETEGVYESTISLRSEPLIRHLEKEGVE